MAASKDINFWTPSGQLLRNKRIIPATNKAELVEYVLLPHNNNVTKPRALNTFLDGLAELGIDKGLIRNKKFSQNCSRRFLIRQFLEKFENTSEMNPQLPSGQCDYIYKLNTKRIVKSSNQRHHVPSPSSTTSHVSSF